MRFRIAPKKSSRTVAHGFNGCGYRRLLLLFFFYFLFTAIGFAPGGSTTLVQTKTIKQHYTVVQHNTIKRKQLRDFSPQANYTDRAIAAAQYNKTQTQ
jgi:hypothetical protein